MRRRRPGRPAVLLCAGLAMAAVDAGLLVAFGRTGWAYGVRVSVELYVLELVTMLAFLVGGYAATRLRPSNRTGTLMQWLGLVLAVDGSAGDLLVTHAWPVVALRTVAVLFAPAQWALTVHIVLAYPSGTLRDRASAVMVRVCYAAACIGPTVSVVSRHVPLCDGCPSALGLGLLSDGVAQRLYAADILLWAVLLSAALAVFVRRYRRASVRERSIMAYPLKAVGAGAVVLVAFLVEAALARGLGLPILLPLAEAMNVVGALVLPLGFLLGLVRERFEQARVADLVRRLPTTPLARLTPALATALGDPDARLVYPAGDGYVDETGRPATPRADQRLAPAGPAAFLLYDEILTTQPDLVDAAANAAALSLDNARLHAAARDRLAEVNASRARIVDATDEARRRLERDLHDGAQQRLVALGLALRLVRRRLPETDPETAALIEETERHARGAIDELRELARGIHPAILTDHGLPAAVEQLAGRCPVPVRVDIAAVDRCAARVEATAYFVLSEALANVAKHSGAALATVAVHHAAGRLRVEVTDDGCGGAVVVAGSGLRGLEDRVAAAAGTLVVEDLPDGGTRVRADLPTNG